MPGKELNSRSEREALDLSKLQGREGEEAEKWIGGEIKTKS